MTWHLGLAPLLALLLAACGGGSKDDWPVAADLQRDIEATDLRIDIASRTASAQIQFGASATPGASLEVGDLRIDTVSVDGRPIDFRRSGKLLDLAVGSAATTVRIDYAWQVHPDAGGVALGSTLTWPQACGNMFPCHSSPSDGSRFTLTLSGVPAGQVAVYAASIPEAAPAYQLAWSIGTYQRTALGRTAAGTDIVRWNHAEEEDAAAQGSAYLVAGFDWLERSLGPYRFGREAGPVSAHWAGDGWAGMETHPLWHVNTSALADERVQLHEAAHGWFGNGVRLACWEDMVLSEGAATYYEARLLEEVAGAARGQAVWRLLDAELAGLRERGGGGVARPAGCNQTPPQTVFSRAIYVKGAHYLRALERRLTRPAFDASMRTLYSRFGGRAAGISDLVAVILEQTGHDATACTRDWLQSTTIPTDSTCL